MLQAGVGGAQLARHLPTVEAFQLIAADVGRGLGKAAEAADLMLAVGGQGEDRPRAQAKQGKTHFDKGAAVGQVHDHIVTGLQAKGTQATGQAPAAVREAGITQVQGAVGNCDCCRVSGSGSVEGLGERLLLPVAGLAVAFGKCGRPVGGVVGGIWHKDGGTQ
ncbi:hypothetical protein D3C80_613530 [compost metagenome]